MKVVITVNDYKEVRRRWLNGESQRSIARAMGISRNTVKKYCEGENVPWERKEYLRAPSVLTPDVQAFIAAYLKADAEEGTSKQQHTAKRIYDRLVDEMGFTGGESTIRAYVSACKGSAKEAFVPLAFAPGDALQIDWGEATIVLAGVKKYCEGENVPWERKEYLRAARHLLLQRIGDRTARAFSMLWCKPLRILEVSQGA